MKFVSKFAAALFATTLLGMTGCGGTYDSSVSGIVTLAGSPLPRGTVSFHPVSDGPSAYGNIKGDGSYSVSTGREEGLPSGEYIVTVVANEESVQLDPNSGLPPMPGKVLTPAWYRTKDASPLKFTLEGGSNEIKIELTSQPPAGWQEPGRPRR